MGLDVDQFGLCSRQREESKMQNPDTLAGTIGFVVLIAVLLGMVFLGRDDRSLPILHKISRVLEFASAFIWAYLASSGANGRHPREPFFDSIGHLSPCSQGLKVLKGSFPGELPIEVASNHELAINLSAARHLGVTVTPELLARAGQTIHKSGSLLRNHEGQSAARERPLGVKPCRSCDAESKSA